MERGRGRRLEPRAAPAEARGPAAAPGLSGDRAGAGGPRSGASRASRARARSSWPRSARRARGRRTGTRRSCRRAAAPAKSAADAAADSRSEAAGARLARADRRVRDGALAAAGAGAKRRPSTTSCSRSGASARQARRTRWRWRSPVGTLWPAPALVRRTSSAPRSRQVSSCSAPAITWRRGRRGTGARAAARWQSRHACRRAARGRAERRCPASGGWCTRRRARGPGRRVGLDHREVELVAAGAVARRAEIGARVGVVRRAGERAGEHPPPTDVADRAVDPLVRERPAPTADLGELFGQGGVAVDAPVEACPCTRAERSRWSRPGRGGSAPSRRGRSSDSRHSRRAQPAGRARVDRGEPARKRSAATTSGSNQDATTGGECHSLATAAAGASTRSHCLGWASRSRARELGPPRPAPSRAQLT